MTRTETGPENLEQDPLEESWRAITTTWKLYHLAGLSNYLVSRWSWLQVSIMTTALEMKAILMS